MGKSDGMVVEEGEESDGEELVGDSRDAGGEKEVKEDRREVLVEEGVVVGDIPGCTRRVSHIHLQFSFYL